LEAISGPQ